MTLRLLQQARTRCVCPLTAKPRGVSWKSRSIDCWSNQPRACAVAFSVTAFFQVTSASTAVQPSRESGPTVSKSPTSALRPSFITRSESPDCPALAVW